MASEYAICSCSRILADSVCSSSPGNTGTVFLNAATVPTRTGVTNVWAGTLKLSNVIQPAGPGLITAFSGATVEFNGNLPHASNVSHDEDNVERSASP